MRCPVCFEEDVTVTDGVDGLVIEHYYRWREKLLPCPMSGKPLFTWGEGATRAAVPGRSGGYCEYSCGARATNMHHRIPLSQGGWWSPANILHLCGSGTTGCHGYFTEHPDHAKRIGVILLNTQKPADVPVLTKAGPLWLSDDIAPPWPCGAR